MTPAPERIMEQLARVKRLMDNAGTEGEAAAAAAAMARLLQKYNLDLQDVRDVEDVELDSTIYGDEEVQLDFNGRDFNFKINLLWAIARYNFCSAVVSSITDTKAPREFSKWEQRLLKQDPTRYGPNGRDQLTGHFPKRKTMILIGQRHNTEVVRFLYDIIMRKLTELAKAYPIGETTIDTGDFQFDPFNDVITTYEDQLALHLYNTHDARTKKRSEDRTEWVPLTPDELARLHRHVHSGSARGQFGPRKSFLFGAVKAIEGRLGEQWDAMKRGQMGDASKALALVETTRAALAQYNKDHYYTGKYTGARTLGLHQQSYAAGFAAGKRLEFQKGVGGGSSKGVGARALGTGKR